MKQVIIINNKFKMSKGKTARFWNNVKFNDQTLNVSEFNTDDLIKKEE